MKLKKKSGLIGIVVALSAASLISVGFATWVMTQGDTKNVDGSIVVDTVQDNRYLIGSADPVNYSVDYGLNKSNVAATGICFGWDATGASGVWLTNEDTSKAENLTADVIFYVSNLETTDSAVLSANLSLTGAADKQTAWAAAVTANYIEDLSAVTKTFTIDPSVTETYGGLTYRKVTLSLTFKWGSHFGSPAKNPYAFYNNGTNTVSTSGADASTALKAIEAFSGVGFRVTLITGSGS